MRELTKNVKPGTILEVTKRHHGGHHFAVKPGALATVVGPADYKTAEHDDFVAVAWVRPNTHGQCDGAYSLGMFKRAPIDALLKQKSKSEIAALEARVAKLERVIRAFERGITNA